MEKKRRVLLKLSGEALAGEKKTGFDEETVKEVARQVKISADSGVPVSYTHLYNVVKHYTRRSESEVRKPARSAPYQRSRYV